MAVDETLLNEVHEVEVDEFERMTDETTVFQRMEEIILTVYESTNINKKEYPLS